MYKLFWFITIIILFVECIDTARAETNEDYKFHLKRSILCYIMTIGWIVCYVKGLII